MGENFSRAASLNDLPQNQRVRAQMGLLTDMLGDGRRFLLGDTLSAADLTAYHTMWFTKKNGGAEAEAMLPFEPLMPWRSRAQPSRRRSAPSRIPRRGSRRETPYRS